MDTGIETPRAIVSAIDRLAAAAPGPARAAAFDAIESACLDAVRAGIAAVAIAPLERACRLLPRCARAWWLLGVVLREEQRHPAALAAMERARALAPDEAHAALGVAQLRLETGREAVAAFRAAQALRPDDADVARALSVALAAAGDGAAADATIAVALATRPTWVEGQAYRATLRRTAGDADTFDRGFADAVAAAPGDAALRLGWAHLLVKAKAWDRARRVVRAATATFGAQPALATLAAVIASESGESDDPALFDGIADRGDPGVDVARVRHALRVGHADDAAGIAVRHVGTPAAASFWPYLSLAWRVLGDARAAWLDRPAAFVRETDLGLGAAEIDELAALLRSLHTMAAPYLDQSVRGGTQTDRPLLFRHEPIVARVRDAIAAAVRAYADALPAREAGHPLLDTPRHDIRFAGSWSVRLLGQGFHASHTHPAGWLSSAFYVALPDPPGAAPAGWLRLGTPPPELGLDLPPYRSIAPKVGRLVLFPSTLWHGTAPFDDGERLTLAFDIRRPRW